MGDLNRLRRWVFKRQMEHLRHKERQQQTVVESELQVHQPKPKRKPMEEAEQHTMFDFTNAA